MNQKKWSPAQTEKIRLWGTLDDEWQRDSTPPDRKEEISIECNGIACELGDPDPLGRRDRMRFLVLDIKSTSSYM